jgi:hypothetical protein
LAAGALVRVETTITIAQPEQGLGCGPEAGASDCAETVACAAKNGQFCWR